VDIDSTNRIRQIDYFLLGKVAAGSLVYIIRHMRLGDEGHRSRSGERRLFSLVKAIGFPPYDDILYTFLALPASRSRLACRLTQFAQPFTCEARSLTNSSNA
jgi:hypothetical protein